MALPFDTVTKRKKLPVKKSAYWHKIRVGVFIGYRRNKNFGASKWILRNENGQQALGREEDMDYEAALKLAMVRLDIGVTNTKYTVSDAIADYKKEITARKGAKKAEEGATRIENKLSDKLLAQPLADLKRLQIKNWHNSMVKDGDEETIRKSRDTANRVLSILKAVLNNAFTNGLAATDTAWKSVKPFEEVGANRTLFLSDDQVQTLLSSATGDLHDLCKAGILTSSRYGELVALRVKDFDPSGVLRIAGGKTGGRDCYLSDSALAFFKTMTRGKLPNAVLLPLNGQQWGPGDQRRRIQYLVRDAKLPRETVFYSLRHYYISKALLAGVQPQVVAENCGTSLRMIEKHYGKFLKTDRRTMLNMVAL